LAEELPWPPRKEDLERLYVAQGLSAAKIARVYGLKYESEKTAESTILYHLKRNGIKRRDRAAHIRKVTEETVDGWVSRYRSGESLKQIAGTDVDPVTVFNHLRRRGVQLRDKVEAQIQAVTKHERTPFTGTPADAAYISGLVIGDCNVVRHGRGIRVRTTTTHPGMAELFEQLFGKFGYVHINPRRTRLRESEWDLQVDLDRTFQFLEKDPCEALRQYCGSDETFWSFMAGFFDAEGGIRLHRKRGGIGFELQITNTNGEILELPHEQLVKRGISTCLRKLVQNPTRLGGKDEGEVWNLTVWRYADVRKLLGILPLKHKERVAKLEIALELRYRAPIWEREVIQSEWDELIRQIKVERNEFALAARKALAQKPSGM